MAKRRLQDGLTLIEVLIAMTLAAIVLAALDSIVMLGLQAHASNRQANELAYQARFALDKMAAKARSAAPKPLATPPPATTGDWFSPTKFCLNSTNRLVETVVSDMTCTGGAVIANNVIAFSAQLPAGAGPVDDPAVTLSLTLQAKNAPAVTLTTNVRLGGGAL